MKEQSEAYKQVIKFCIKKILEQKTDSLLVAVTGESGSGKSYFTKSLYTELERMGIECTFINHDDFLIPRKEREELKNIIYKNGEFKGKTQWEILENWYYLTKFEDVLDKLKSHMQTAYYPYERATGTISKHERIINPKPIILLENKLFLDKMDFIIELRVSRQNNIKRKINRDRDVRTPEQTIEMHEKTQGYFWDRQKFLIQNIVIDNNDFENPKIIETNK